jgi:hypothetical protein
MASITKMTPVKAREWLWHSWGIPYQLNIVDVEGSVGLDLGVYGAPETYVLDADGVIAHRHVGVLNEAVFQRDFSRWFSAAASPSGRRAGAEGVSEVIVRRSALMIAR